ncbi:MAG TPA: dihydroneopterin aldolase [Acidimicrobiales bacterium]|nr:dihydroneopterin aldolase [Acidimicrobiales bacterium]
MSLGDRIEVRGLRVVGRHGVLPEERERAQPFEIDLDIEADLGPAASSDDLGRTLDYGVLAASVAALVEKESFQLLEALAEAVASLVLEHPLCEAVGVRVRKLRPPVALDLGSVAVFVHRRRR